MPINDPDRIIDLLHLKPLPVEGGFYRRTYLAPETLGMAFRPGGSQEPKSLASAIYYLLKGQDFSALHRLPTDEIYHFYLGDPVEILELFPDGSSDLVTLGPDLESGQQVQTVVAQGVWQGARLVTGGRFALVGTTLAPAYTDSDFELGLREQLIRQYPARTELVRALTRE